MAIEVDRKAKVGQLGPDPVGALHGVEEREALQGHEGENVERPHPRMHAAVLAEIDVFEGKNGRRHRRCLHGLGLSDESDDGPVVMGVC